jgi:putative pyruvate formate lyase activating enzyme
VLRLLDGIVDIYLPDFKYMDGAAAGRYSAGANDYPEVAAAAIREMHRQVGELVTDRDGIARRGVMIRHLVLPHNLAGTDRFVRFVATGLGPSAYVNIMPQYCPAHRAGEFPELSRRTTEAEFRQAVDWAIQAGLTRLDAR